MKLLEKTKKLLNDRRRQNTESKYGVIISDSTWRNVKEEINKTEGIIKRYRISTIILIILVITISLI